MGLPRLRARLTGGQLPQQLTASTARQGCCASTNMANSSRSMLTGRQSGLPAGCMPLRAGQLPPCSVHVRQAYLERYFLLFANHLASMTQCRPRPADADDDTMPSFTCTKHYRSLRCSCYAIMVESKPCPQAHVGSCAIEYANALHRGSKKVTKSQAALLLGVAQLGQAAAAALLLRRCNMSWTATT